MALLDWLRKLGIVRFGAEKAVYHNAKERPMSFMSDDVLDSKKDVIDLDRKAEKPAEAAASAEPAETASVER